MPEYKDKDQADSLFSGADLAENIVGPSGVIGALEPKEEATEIKVETLSDTELASQFKIELVDAVKQSDGEVVDVLRPKDGETRYYKELAVFVRNVNQRVEELPTRPSQGYDEVRMLAESLTRLSETAQEAFHASFENTSNVANRSRTEIGGVIDSLNSDRPPLKKRARQYHLADRIAGRVFDNSDEEPEVHQPTGLEAQILGVGLAQAEQTPKGISTDEISDTITSQLRSIRYSASVESEDSASQRRNITRRIEELHQAIETERNRFMENEDNTAVVSLAQYVFNESFAIQATASEADRDGRDRNDRLEDITKRLTDNVAVSIAKLPEAA